MASALYLRSNSANRASFDAEMAGAGVSNALTVEGTGCAALVGCVAVGAALAVDLGAVAGAVAVVG